MSGIVDPLQTSSSSNTDSSPSTPHEQPQAQPSAPWINPQPGTSGLSSQKRPATVSGVDQSPAGRPPAKVARPKGKPADMPDWVKPYLQPRNPAKPPAPRPPEQEVLTRYGLKTDLPAEPHRSPGVGNDQQNSVLRNLLTRNKTESSARPSYGNQAQAQPQVPGIAQQPSTARLPAQQHPTAASGVAQPHAGGQPTGATRPGITPEQKSEILKEFSRRNPTENEANQLTQATRPEITLEQKNAILETFHYRNKGLIRNQQEVLARRPTLQSSRYPESQPGVLQPQPQRIMPSGSQLQPQA